MRKKFLSLALTVMMVLSLLPTSAFAANQTPVKISNITLSNVLTTNEYGTAKELLPGGDFTAEYEYLYGLGNIGFWNETDKEYRLGTFCCYLAPEDASISIHLSKEIPECYVYMYTLKEGEAMLGSRYWQTTFITGLKYEPDYGKSEADILISKEYIEGGLASMNLDPKFDLLQIVSGNEDILVWFGGPSASAPSFTDVPAGEWYSDPVAWAVERGITNGTEPGKFSPGQNCTQIQILTFLSRAAGNTNAKDYDWSAEQSMVIKWAKEKGMIDDSFNGSTPCTRATAASYIWQAFDKPSAKASSFTDVPASAAYAKAVNWAVEKGVTNGTSSTSFSPKKRATGGKS